MILDVVKKLIWPATLLGVVFLLKGPLLTLTQPPEPQAPDPYSVPLSESVEFYDFIQPTHIDQRFLAFDLPQANSSFLSSGKSECSTYALYDNEGINLEDPELFGKITDINSLIRKSIFCGKFEGLVVVDKEGVFLGSFEKDYFLEAVIYWDSYPGFASKTTVEEKLSWLRKHVHYTPALMYPQNMLDQEEGSTVFVRESDSVNTAIDQIRINEVPFVPILNDKDQVVGILSKENLVDKLLRDQRQQTE